MHAIEQYARDFIRYWTFPLLRPRRFHAFGVGMPKSGTHSLAGVFRRYRALHEPYRERFMQLIMAREDGKLSADRTQALVRGLDRRLWPELNASYLNYFLLDLLLDEYPDARFVLTIRDCYSWVDSSFNQLLGRSHAEYHNRFHNWYAESMSPGTHQDGDRVLAEHGLWPLDGWLRTWAQHNTRTMDMIPAGRLLIVRTQDIRNDIPRMADFFGVPPETLDSGRSHEHKAAKKFGLLSRIAPDYLRERVEANCSDLMERFFPEIKGLSDVPGYGSQDIQAKAS